VFDSPEVREEPLSAEHLKQFHGFVVDVTWPAESVKNHTAETAHLPAQGCATILG
jgi:hypothetical protein